MAVAFPRQLDKVHRQRKSGECAMQTAGLTLAVLSAFFLSIFIFDPPIGLQMLAIVRNWFGIGALQAWFLIVIGLPSGLAIGVTLIVFSLRK